MLPNDETRVRPVEPYSIIYPVPRNTASVRLGIVKISSTRPPCHVSPSVPTLTLLCPLSVSLSFLCRVRRRCTALVRSQTAQLLSARTRHDTPIINSLAPVCDDVSSSHGQTVPILLIFPAPDIRPSNRLSTSLFIVQRKEKRKPHGCQPSHPPVLPFFLYRLVRPHSPSRTESNRIDEARLTDSSRSHPRSSGSLGPPGSN